MLERTRCLDKGMRFAELSKILEGYGYRMTQPRKGSSHYTFKKVGCSPITIPRHEPIKIVYVRMVREIVEAESVSRDGEE